MPSVGTQPPMFTISTVDNHGFHERGLPDNDAPLDLDNFTLCIHWKEEYLNLIDEEKFKVSYPLSAQRGWILNTSQNISTHPSAKVEGSDANEEVTLDKCLQLYTTKEVLGPDDTWYCNKCKEFRQATKKFDLWSTPRILVVHLKRYLKQLNKRVGIHKIYRFSYRNKYFREKLETFVQYPLRGLDLSNHIIGPPNPPPIYDLYAVSNHYGSLGNGHYTAYGLNKTTNKWYKFDDRYRLLCKYLFLMY